MFELKSRFAGKFSAVAAAACAVACAAAIAAPMPAYADEVDDKMAEAEAALQSLNNMMAELDQATANYEAAAAQQQEAEQRVADAQATIDEKTAEIADLQGKLGTRARSMYRSGSSTFLDVLLGSSSFEEFSTNWDMLNTLNSNDAKMVDGIKDARAEVEAAKVTYEEESAKAAEAAQAAADAQAIAADQVVAMQATYESLSAEAAQLLAARTAAQEAAAAEAAAAAAAADGGYTEQVTVTSDQIVSYDESTGTATLADGSTAAVSSYDASTGNAVVDRARSALGSAYVWGGVGGSWGGYDCSGLVSYALSGSNTRLGTTGTFIGWNQVSDPQPGDVCVIHNSSSQHTGIYVGDGKMIHASDYGTGVIESDVQDGMVYVRP